MTLWLPRMGCLVCVLWIKWDTISGLPEGPVRPTPCPTGDDDQSQSRGWQRGALKMKDSFQMHLKEPHLLLGFTFKLSTLFCTFVIH